ncbi:MAG: 3-octaprenyl-4-hydroxybenzoate carboxy-lyase [Waddliaceae bacterium]|nr:3-octaprenyl-4-hydroxybenzoate carboxy-lyase [Waddliaceae bacterium]
MHYDSLASCVKDLEENKHLIRIRETVDPHLEMAAIHRRVHNNGGPALLFESVKNSPFPAVSNLFGTKERAAFIFRSTLDPLKRLIELKADPTQLLRSPFRHLKTPFTALKMLPKKQRTGAILQGQTKIDQLPQIHSWPNDGGAFITLPQVFTRDPHNPSLMKSNLGMYRIQVSGNRYKVNEEVGMHYQIHRGIGIHHAAAIEKGEPLKVSIFVGGSPAHTLAAVLPCPEGLSELTFAGALSGKRFRYIEKDGHTLSADADFCITGSIIPNYTLPEGPFGDHLGYYSLQHPFPVLSVDKVYHREGAIWPFTVVGRPPQEDSIFGHLIHELVGPLVPSEIPGVHALHAVDAAGVHPLLLAMGSERYTPYAERRPQEILTIANAILGFGQCSLAKYLIIGAQEDQKNLKIENISEFLQHILERADWTRDLHFQTRSTIDTLDYSGDALNEGSKLVICGVGKPRRKLIQVLPNKFSIPYPLRKAYIPIPGIIVLEAPKHSEEGLQEIIEGLDSIENWGGTALIVLTDDSAFTAESLDNLLWVTFTRSDPAKDVHGVRAFTKNKHWGCRGPLIIDARIKAHHAPILEEDLETIDSISRLRKEGASLHGII